MIDIDRALSNNYLDDLRDDVTRMRVLIPPVSQFTAREKVFVVVDLVHMQIGWRGKKKIPIMITFASIDSR